MNVTAELGYVHFVTLSWVLWQVCMILILATLTFAWYSYWQPWHIECQTCCYRYGKHNMNVFFILTWPL